MNHDQCSADEGPNPSVINIEQSAGCNMYFRKAVWTGCYAQMTLMCIPVCGNVGMEIHEDTDQFVRVEHGRGLVKMGFCQCDMECERQIGKGDVVFVPAGTWHDIVNVGRCPLKLSSVYSPAHHPKGTIQQTKEN